MMLKLDYLWGFSVASFLVMLMLFLWSILGNNYDGSIAALNNNILDIRGNISTLSLKTDQNNLMVTNRIDNLRESIMQASFKGRK